MDKLKEALNRIAHCWKQTQPGKDGSTRPPVPPEAFRDVIQAAFVALGGTRTISLGSLQGLSGPKGYSVFAIPTGRRESRPFLNQNLFSSELELLDAWDRLVSSLDSVACAAQSIDAHEIDRVLYAASHYVACTFDLFTDNRASAGKFFEYLSGSIVLKLCDARLAPLPVLDKPANYSVPVDVVVKSDRRKDSLIVASKITSRERIVQPFVHHLMVSKAHPGRYKTIILCGSETNRLTVAPGLQETCVAGTIEAYRQTLGGVDGIYYLDLPKKYANAEFAKHIEVSTIGELCSKRLAALYGPQAGV